MKRILVGVDGSSESQTAAALAADLAVTMDAQLLLACATHDGSLQDRETAWSVLRQISAAVGRPGLEVVNATPAGPAAEALAKMAEAPEVIFAVVGHRGRNAAARVLLGSVADRLVQICGKPVLVSRSAT